MDTERTTDSPDGTPAPPAGADLARRVMDAFDRLVGLEPAAQAAALEDLRRVDPDVHGQVRAMLAHDESTAAGPVLRTGAGFPGGVGETESTSEIMVGLPRLSGHYRVLRQIGEGGMGVVFLAEQSVPRRMVALKALKVGLTSRQVLHRFVREAHILGRLQHPGIAAIFEAGVVETNGVDQAYLVMEYVDGAPITTAASARGMAVRERLALMAAVCDAAQHAHQRGVIHRDLKPTNILVDQTGRPKILDFGVARSSADDHELPTRQTLDGQLIGTLGYMSPEQISGKAGDVDAASDVYALGAILYEVLADRPAFDLRGRSLTQAIESVRAARVEPLGQIRRAFRGDIETVVATAMHPERSRRYSSAAVLADDLRRIIDGRPISARRDSAVYVISKIARRHWLLASASVLALALVIAFGVYSWALAQRNADLLVEAQHARRQADAESVRLRSALYSSRIGYAQAALAAGDVGGVRRSLEQCPADLRGWEWRYLDRKSDDAMAAIEVPSGDVAACAVTADGTAAIVATSDAVLTRIDVTRGVRVWTVTLPRPDLWAPVLSPDGRVLVVNGTGGELIRFDPDTGAKTGEMVNADTPEAKAIGCRTVVFSPDGTRMLTGGVDGRVRVFDVASGRLVHVWAAHRRDVASMAFCDDGRLLMTTGTVDGVVTLWDTRTWSRVDGRALDLNGVHVTSAAVSPDGRRVAAATVRAGLVVWTRGVAPESGVERALTGLDRSVLVMSVSPDGRTLATGGRDGLLMLWDLETGANVSTLRGEPDQFRCVHWPTAERIVTTGAFSKLRVWSPRKRAGAVEFGSVSLGAPVVRMLERGVVGVIGSERVGVLRLGRERVETAARFAARQSRDVAVDGDGRLISAGHVPWLRVDDRRGGGAVSVPLDGPGVASMALARGGEALVLGMIDGSVMTLAWPSGEVLARSGKREASVARAMLVPRREGAGEDVVVVWSDGRVGRMSTGDAGRMDALTEDGAAMVETGATLHSGAVSPDGRLVAVVGESGTVRVLSAEMLQERSRSSAALGPVFAAAFIDDTRLAIGGGDRAVRILDVRSGEELLVLKGHRASVTSLTADAATGTLVSVDWFGEVRVYEAGAGRAGDLLH